jgi:hypothetical protein
MTTAGAPRARKLRHARRGAVFALGLAASAVPASVWAQDCRSLELKVEPARLAVRTAAALAARAKASQVDGVTFRVIGAGRLRVAKADGAPLGRDLGAMLARGETSFYWRPEGAPTSKVARVAYDADGSQALLELSPSLAKLRLADARATIDPTGRPVIRLEFDARSKALFAKATASGLGRRMAIVLDEAIVASPFIRAPIVDGVALISGPGSIQELAKTAELMRMRPLPARISTFGETAGCGSLLPAQPAHPRS